jgi:hypothetical protein
LFLEPWIVEVTLEEEEKAKGKVEMGEAEVEAKAKARVRVKVKVKAKAKAEAEVWGHRINLGFLLLKNIFLMSLQLSWLRKWRHWRYLLQCLLLLEREPVVIFPWPLQGNPLRDLAVATCRRALFRLDRFHLPK